MLFLCTEEKSSLHYRLHLIEIILYIQIFRDCLTQRLYRYICDYVSVCTHVCKNLYNMYFVVLYIEGLYNSFQLYFDFIIMKIKNKIIFVMKKYMLM